jgi:hypothetical protein
MALDANQMREAARRIADWRTKADALVAFPACGKAGLAIIDRSARPMPSGTRSRVRLADSTRRSTFR